MTIGEAISRIDSLKFNTCNESDKVHWLSQLDWSVKRNILDACKGAPDFAGYNVDTAMDTVLLVPPPFDDVYLHWLEAQIDYQAGELDRYNAAIILYNTAFEAFASHYRMTHTPVSKGSRFLF